MAVVTVAWTKYMAEKKPWRLALLASRVFGVDSFNYSETERAYILSEELTKFFKKLHLATTLAELKIDNKDFDAMAARAVRNGNVGHYVPLDATAIKDILTLAL
jgi:alcohol dehydrogenase YqhD (iron-dependent ADH family)